AGVDLLPSLVEPFADRRDGRAADADIGLEAVGRGRDRAAADHQIEGLHGSLLAFVMPGLVPGIHVFTSVIHDERRGWSGIRAFTPVFAGLCPAITESLSMPLLDTSAHGVYIIAATPFTDDGAVDTTSLDRLMD